MGHSLVKFRGNGLVLRDKDIAIWIGCVLSEADDVPPSRELTLAFEYWLSPEAFPGQGCFRLNLDLFLTEENTRRELIALTDNAITRVRAFGDTVPAGYLNQHIELFGYVFVALPSTRVVDVLTPVRDLLEGRGSPLPP